MHARLISSSPDSSSLLVVAIAEGSYPVLLKNVMKQDSLVDTVLGKTYKDNVCRAAYLLSFNVAVMVTRSGTVKIANFGTGQIHQVGDKTKKLDHKGPWSSCSLGFCDVGMFALALDRRGKLLVIKFMGRRI